MNLIQCQRPSFNVTLPALSLIFIKETKRCDMAVSNPNSYSKRSGPNLWFEGINMSHNQQPTFHANRNKQTSWNRTDTVPTFQIAEHPVCHLYKTELHSKFPCNTDKLFWKIFTIFVY